MPSHKASAIYLRRCSCDLCVAPHRDIASSTGVRFEAQVCFAFGRSVDPVASLLHSICSRLVASETLINDEVILNASDFDV